MQARGGSVDRMIAEADAIVCSAGDRRLSKTKRPASGHALRVVCTGCFRTGCGSDEVRFAEVVGVAAAFENDDLVIVVQVSRVRRLVVEEDRALVVAASDEVWIKYDSER